MDFENASPRLKISQTLRQSARWVLLHIIAWPACSVSWKIYGCKFSLRYWKSIRFKTGVVDFEGHQFSCKLIRVSFYSWLSRVASWASVTNERFEMNWQFGMLKLTPLLMIPTYPTHSDYYNLVIQFNEFDLSKFRFFFVWFCLKRQRAYTNGRICINNACIRFLLHCASDGNVIFKTFSITLQHISCQDLHQNVFPTWLSGWV